MKFAYSYGLVLRIKKGNHVLSLGESVFGSSYRLIKRRYCKGKWTPFSLPNSAMVNPNG